MRLQFTKTILLFILVVSGFSCKDDRTTIPESEVYVKTTFSEYQTLMSVNRAVVYSVNKIYPLNFKLGYGGVCIFRDLERQIKCCDLSCPYESLRTVTLDIKMPYAICPECGSKFDLTYGQGNPIEGPVKCGLKMYTKIRDTGEYILVTN